MNHSNFSPKHGQSQGEQKQGDGKLHGTDLSKYAYMGPIAAQAVQLIHTQSISQIAQSNTTTVSGGGIMDTRVLHPPNTPLP